MKKLSKGLAAGFLVVMIGALVVAGFWWLSVLTSETAFDVGSFVGGAFSGCVGLIVGSQITSAVIRL